jgi:hypothetical protein
MMVPTIAMCILMGVLPGVFLRPIEPSVRRTIERVTGRSYAIETRPAYPLRPPLAIRESPVLTPTPQPRAEGRVQRVASHD